MANIGTLTARLGVDVRPLAVAATKMKAFTSSARRAFGSITKSVFNLRTALIGLVAILGMRGLARTFIGVGKFVEDMGVRLKVLLGSVEEGTRLFKDLGEYASRVPFQLQGIMDSATRLASVMRGGREQIMSWLPLIGDLAAAYGMTIERTSEQMVRALSAGIGAADYFREKGVTAFLGFQAGVAYTAQETAQIISDAWTRMESRFRGATEDMAKTWTGLISMVQDQWFQMRRTILEAGLWDALKEGLNSVLNLMKRIQASGLIEEWAARVGAAFERIDWNKILNSLWEMAQISRHVYKAIRYIVGGYVKMYEWADRLLGLTEESKLIKEMGASAERQISLQKSLNRLFEERDEIRKRILMLGPISGDIETEALATRLDYVKKWITETKRLLEQELDNYQGFQARFREVFDVPLLPELPEVKIEPRVTIDPIVEGLGAVADSADKASEAIFRTREELRALEMGALIGEKIREDWTSKFVAPVYESAKKTFDYLEQLSIQAARNMQDAFASFFFRVMKWEFDNLRAVGRAFADAMMQMLAELAAKMLIMKLIATGIFGAAGGGGEPTVLTAQHGMRINEPIAGMGKSGQRYLFGEAGPEWVVPATGRIAPREERELNQNIYLVDEREQVPPLGPNDVITIISADFASDGLTRKTFKRFG